MSSYETGKLIKNALMRKHQTGNILYRVNLPGRPMHNALKHASRKQSNENLCINNHALNTSLCMQHERKLMGSEEMGSEARPSYITCVMAPLQLP